MRVLSPRFGKGAAGPERQGLRHAEELHDRQDGTFVPQDMCRNTCKLGLVECCLEAMHNVR